MSAKTTAAAPTVTTSAAGPPTPVAFDLGPRLPAGDAPTAVATGDFNGDGHADFVVANGIDNDIWFYAGNGDGTFKLPTRTELPLASSPVWIAAADLRGNGVLDLIVAEADMPAIAVLLGKGDGSFEPQATYPIADLPTMVASADFNGDGHLDVIAITFAGKIAMYPGSGDGGLQPPIYTQAVGDSFLALAIADLNGDGFADVIVTSYIEGAQAFLNDRTGHFVLSQFIYGGNPDNDILPFSTAAGDIDGDGCPDAAVSELDAPPVFTIAHVFKGNCDGTFSPPSGSIPGAGLTIDTGTSVFPLALVDVDHDGHPDLVGGAVYSMGVIDVMHGDGHGNFARPRTYRTGAEVWSLAVADFNGDGLPDVVTANQQTNDVSVLLNDGAGGFASPSGISIGYPIYYMQSIYGSVPQPGGDGPLLADFDGDGTPDVAVLNGPIDGAWQITVALNQQGRFGTALHSPVPICSGGPDWLAGDFRNSGHKDVVFASGADCTTPAVTLLVGNGDGTFGNALTTTLPIPPPVTSGFNSVLAAGDLNGDGKLDLVIETANQLLILLGRGDGTFNTQPPIPFATDAGSTMKLYIGDFNRDGKSDILAWNWVSSGAGRVYELLGSGDGTFSPPVLLFDQFGIMATADVNHDGFPEIVETNIPTGTLIATVETSPFISIYVSQTDGTFKLLQSYQPFDGYAWTSLVPLARPSANHFPLIGDFNGDGNLDIALVQGNFPGGYFIQDSNLRLYAQVLLGNGDGTFTPSYVITDFADSTAPVFVADINGDGRDDLVQLDPGANALSVTTAQPALPVSIALVRQPVIGTHGRARVTLTFSSAADTSISLSASDTAISIPSSITIPAGAHSQEVEFVIGPGFDAAHRVFEIDAQLGNGVARAYGVQQNDAFYGFTPRVGCSVPGVAPGGTILCEVDNSSQGYTTEIVLSCSGLPPGASCIFDRNPVTLGSDLFSVSQLSIPTSAATPAGTYTLTVTETDGVLSTLAGTNIAVGSNFTVAANSLSDGSGALEQTFDVALIPQAFFGEDVTLTCSGVPAGASCAVSPVHAVPGLSTVHGTVRLLRGTAPAGDYQILITAAARSQSHDISLLYHLTDIAGQVSPATAALERGRPAEFQVQVTSQNGFAGAVELSCADTPGGIHCLFDPARLNLSSNSSQTATLRIYQSNRLAIVYVNRQPKAAVWSRGEWEPSQQKAAGPLLIALLGCFAVFLVRLTSNGLSWGRLQNAWLASSVRSPLRSHRVVAGCCLAVVIGSSYLLSCGTTHGLQSSTAANRSVTIAVLGRVAGRTKSLGNIRLSIP